MAAKSGAAGGGSAVGEEDLRIFLHDIRNPISAILGFAHLLESRNDDLSDEQRSKVLDSLNRTAQRLSALVDDFSDERSSTTDKE